MFVRTGSPMNTHPSLFTGSYFMVSQIRGVAPTRNFQWIKEPKLFDISNRSSSHTASSRSMAVGHADIWLSPVVNWFNPLNAKLNPICQLLALLVAHPILHISRIRVNCILIYILNCLGRMTHSF